MTPHDIDYPPPRLAFSVRGEDGYIVAAIGGDLDIACVPALREQLLGLLGPHANRIIVELSGVTFCDASGLAVLIGARRRAWLLGGVLRLAAPAPPVAAVLRLTGLDVHFEIFATVLAAASAPAGPQVPDVSPHRQAPAGPPGIGSADPGRRWQQPAGADDDDVHEAVTALLAHADAWRDADPDRRRPAPFPRWPVRTPAPAAAISGKRPGRCWPACCVTRSPTRRPSPRPPPSCAWLLPSGPSRPAVHGRPG